MKGGRNGVKRETRIEDVDYRHVISWQMVARDSLFISSMNERDVPISIWMRQYKPGPWLGRAQAPLGAPGSAGELALGQAG